MNRNLGALIDQAITMSDGLGLTFSLHYTKDNIRFLFMKGDSISGWDFSAVELSDIVDVNILHRKLRVVAYSLLDKHTGEVY